MEYTKLTIKETMALIGAKKLYLPAIQRKFVWDHEQIEKLFDSIMRDYPIGTFLFWMVEEANRNDYSFYEFIREFHTRDNWKNPLAAKPHLPDALVGVLDGQQRINSMYVALQGTYAYKRPRAWSTSPDAYPVRQFYLNVFKPEVVKDGDEHVYDFSFLTPQEAAKTTSEECWCCVKDMLDCKGVPEVNKHWAKMRAAVPTDLPVSEDLSDGAVNILVRLWERLCSTPVINYFPVKNQILDDVLDIFVRVNSAGTPLAKTDLLFSTIVAHWEDGRAEIENLLQRVNAKGNKFWFDTDFVMRASLVLSGCPIQLRVASFKQQNVERLIDDWTAISSSIERAVDLLVEWGFEGATLPSLNAVIPVAYAVKLGVDLKTSKGDLRLLLIKSLLFGTYGSSGDQVLSNIRKTMDAMAQGSTTFTLAEFEKEVRLPGGKSLAFTEELLDELLLSTIGSRTFALLSLLTPHLKFNQVQFHQDHIHPHAGFGTGELRKLKLTDEQIWEWQAKRDALPNLQLLEGRENQSKQAKPFVDWLKKEYPVAADAKAFRRSQNIPDVSLELSDFSEFFEKRRAVLRQRLSLLLRGADRSPA